MRRRAACALVWTSAPDGESTGKPPTMRNASLRRRSAQGEPSVARCNSSKAAPPAAASNLDLAAPAPEERSCNWASGSSTGASQNPTKVLMEEMHSSRTPSELVLVKALASLLAATS
eukprot:scaffold5640_cov30-Tisochrysis_lutea.AAC.6